MTAGADDSPGAQTKTRTNSNFGQASKLLAR
jgi:hypothetical protein